MKQLLLCLIIFAVSSLAEEKNKEAAKAAPKLEMKMSTHSAKIIKVFSASEDQARFLAYQVMWKGQEIIVTDMFAKKAKKAGENVIFISQSMNMPSAVILNKRQTILQFTVMPDYTLSIPIKKESKAKSNK